MSTHNISFCGEIRKILCGYPFLSRSMIAILLFPFYRSISTGIFMSIIQIISNIL